jgi:predicted metal-dependent hydrolase
VTRRIDGDPMAGDDRDERLARGIDLFNRRDFFASHELFEALWREAAAAERPLYEALVQLATALHLRFNRGGQRGSVNLLTQALVHLEDLRPVAGGIDTAGLYEEVSGYVERLRAEPGASTWLERLRAPKIRRRG